MARDHTVSKLIFVVGNVVWPGLKSVSDINFVDAGAEAAYDKHIAGMATYTTKIDDIDVSFWKRIDTLWIENEIYDWRNGRLARDVVIFSTDGSGDILYATTKWTLKNCEIGDIRNPAYSSDGPVPDEFTFQLKVEKGYFDRVGIAA